jgi:hypothetical protein
MNCNEKCIVQVSIRIKSAIQMLGTSCIELVQDAGSLQSNPTGGFARRDLSVHSKKVLENASTVAFFIFIPDFLLNASSSAVCLNGST